MNGTSHAVIGAGVGAIAAFSVDADPMLMTTLVATGLVSGLVPDLDTGGKLANRITLSDSFLKMVSLLLGAGVIAYSWTQAELDWQKVVGLVLGLLIIFLFQKLSSKIMLLITGLAVIITGYMTSTLWILLVGIYIAVASFLPHRSYTHSLIGLAFYSYIAYEFTKELALPNVVMMTAILGYISHLLADSRFIPSNKQGVKFFLPFSSKQF